MNGTARPERYDGLRENRRKAALALFLRVTFYTGILNTGGPIGGMGVKKLAACYSAEVASVGNLFTLH